MKGLVTERPLSPVTDAPVARVSIPDSRRGGSWILLKAIRLKARKERKFFLTQEKRAAIAKRVVIQPKKTKVVGPSRRWAIPAKSNIVQWKKSQMSSLTIHQQVPP